MGFEVALAEEIGTAKYRFAPTNGEADDDFAATATRVALVLVEAEAPDDRTKWFERFRESMLDFRFLPAGRIIAGAGRARSVTLVPEKRNVGSAGRAQPRGRDAKPMLGGISALFCATCAAP